MQIFSIENNNSEISILHSIPKKFIYSPESPAIAIFDNGEECSIGCLSCYNPKCMKLSKYEIECENVPAFPSSQNIDVCPVNAISWNAELNIPEINNNICIKCGICMRRCPVGAIYFQGEIKINTTSSLATIEKVTNDTSHKLEQSQLNNLERVEKSGFLIKESENIFFEIYDKLSKIESQYHNIIARNLLISLGNKCSMRRIGDVYTRMDAIYHSHDDLFGVLEVEFGRDTLDASRGILDDIAVLNARYNVPKNLITPLVVCLNLPNVRQGYWQVVKDIKKVESIKINTISIGTLILMNWNLCTLELQANPYYLDYDNTNLRAIVEYVLKRQIDIGEKCLGILEPQK